MRVSSCVAVREAFQRGDFAFVRKRVARLLQDPSLSEEERKELETLRLQTEPTREETLFFALAAFAVLGTAITWMFYAHP